MHLESLSTSFLPPSKAKKTFVISMETDGVRMTTESSLPTERKLAGVPILSQINFTPIPCSLRETLEVRQKRFRINLQAS